MSSCYICSENFKRPVSLPCGHVFCSHCIFTTAQTVKSLHRCPSCGSWYSIAPLDTETVPSNLRPFVTPSVRPLHMDVMRSDKTESTCKPNESSMRTARSSPLPSTTSPSDDKVLSEMARLRAENNALRNNCSMWRKRAEVHGEANLNLLNFARAMRDQASQIARDRNELENRCLMLKQQLDGDAAYCDEMQKYGQSSRPPPAVDLSKLTGEDKLHCSIPSALPGSRLSSGNKRLDSNQSRKRPRISGDNRE